MKILNEVVEGKYLITDFTVDGSTVIYTRKSLIPKNTNLIESEIQATTEEQILAENQYQTALLEMQMLGGL